MGSHYSAGDGFPAVAGADGVGRTADGRRVYFVLPQAPFGALADRCLVRGEQCVDVPDEVDNITAAAIANPGMSAWAALVERAHLQPGDVVLINGATGSAGRLAVQLAKYLGAGKVIATARNEAELDEVRALGADEVVVFRLDGTGSDGARGYEDALLPHFAAGVDVVLDYLWGESAKTVMIAIAKGAENGKPVRFVHVGGASGEETLALPGAALRSSGIVLMGSGVKSVPMSGLLGAIGNVFRAVGLAKLEIATRTLPLSAVEEGWKDAAGKPRLVFTIGDGAHS